MAIEVDPRDREDLRFAVVMTGGVSLAIWMGGAALELNRLRSPETGSAYGELLALSQSDVRIDIIAGTSAGGLNGAFLATATAYDRPLDDLRRTWLSDGSLYDLMSDPRAKGTISLLDGDGYFLPRLQAAFQGIKGTSALRSNQPLELFMTAALLRGEGQLFFDRYENEMPEITHLGLFKFVLQDFAGADIVEKLALAARTSASHPGGFEASYIPMSDEDASEGHPNMTGFATWKSSRFVVDGGVLLNRPLQPALEAVLRQSAEREVRRLVLFVAPDPGRIAPDKPDKVEERPTFAKTVLSVARLPAVQSITEQLRDIEDYNSRVIRQRRVRAELSASGESLSLSAPALYPAYRALRSERNAEAVVEQLALVPGPARSVIERAKLRQALEVAFAERYPNGPPIRGSSFLDPWPWGTVTIERAVHTVQDYLRQAIDIAPPDPVGTLELQTPRSRLRALRAISFQVLQRAWTLRGWDRVYWQSLAPTTPSSASPWLERALDALPQFLAQRDVADPPPWRKEDSSTTNDPRAELALCVGLAMTSAAGVVARVAADVISGSVEGPSPTQDEQIAAVKLIEQLYGFAGILGGVQSRDIRPGQSMAPWSQDPTNPLGRAREYPEQTGIDSAALYRLIDQLELAELLAGPSGDRSRLVFEVEFWLWRLLMLEVSEVPMLAADRPADREIELVQLSSKVQNAFDSRRNPSDKLTGLQLAHFGAFYKMSWRANDWMWGRLDAASHLSQILLDASRLQRLRFTTDEAVRAIKRIAVADDGPSSLREFLSQDALTIESELRSELAFLSDSTASAPPALPRASHWVARRMQLEILQEELPWVARSVASDMALGGAANEKARLFLNEYLGFPGGKSTVEELGRRFQKQILAGSQPLDDKLEPGRAIDLFKACRVGEEKLSQEVGSDMFSTTSTKGTAAAIATASGPKAGIGPLRALFGSMRGLSLALYSLTRGAVETSSTKVALITGAIVLGAVVVAFEAVDKFDSLRVVNGIALLLLVAGLAAASIRTLWPVQVLGIALGTLAGFLLIVVAAPTQSLWGLVVVVVGSLVIVALLTGAGRIIRAHRWYASAAGALFTLLVVGGLLLFVLLAVPVGHPGLPTNCGAPAAHLALRLPPSSSAPTASVAPGSSASPSQATDALVCAGIVRDWEVRTIALLLAIGGGLSLLALRRPQREPKPEEPAGDPG